MGALRGAVNAPVHESLKSFTAEISEGRSGNSFGIRDSVRVPTSRGDYNFFPSLFTFISPLLHSAQRRHDFSWFTVHGSSPVRRTRESDKCGAAEMIVDNVLLVDSDGFSYLLR